MLRNKVYKRIAIDDTPLWSHHDCSASTLQERKERARGEWLSADSLHLRQISIDVNMQMDVSLCLGYYPISLIRYHGQSTV